MELGFLLAADCGTMQDEKTGRNIDWMNCHYLTDYREDTDTGIGFKPIKIGCTPDAFAIFRQHGIGLYKLDFKTRPGAGGKPALTLVRAECVGKVDLFDMSNYRARSTAPASSGAPVPKAS